MLAVKNAIFDRLAGAASVTARIGTFKGVPAIFSRQPIPPTASGTYIVIPDAIGDDAGVGDTKTTLGRDVAHDLGIYADETGDPAAVEQLAEIVRDLFHREPLIVDGYGSALVSRVSGPIEAPAEPEIYGRIVTVSFSIIRT